MEIWETVKLAFLKLELGKRMCTWKESREWSDHKQIFIKYTWRIHEKIGWRKNKNQPMRVEGMESSTASPWVGEDRRDDAGEKHMAVEIAGRFEISHHLIKAKELILGRNLM